MQALSLLFPYGTLTLCKKLEKTTEQSLRYLKMDRPTDHGWTDRQVRLLRALPDKPRIQITKKLIDSQRLTNRQINRETNEWTNRLTGEG